MQSKSQQPVLKTQENTQHHEKKTYLYNISFPDLKDISQITKSGDGMKYQWSKDKMQGYHKFQPNPLYFRLAGENGLEINIYKGDLKFNQKTETSPRTQLRALAKIYDNIRYVFSFDQFLANLPTFDYAFAQVHGGMEANIMLKWRNGAFILQVKHGDRVKAKFPGKLEDIVGKWVNWRIQFFLSQKGYVRLYKDNVLMANLQSNNSAMDSSFIKAGIYCQKMDPSNNVKIYLKNFYVYTVGDQNKN